MILETVALITFLGLLFSGSSENAIENIEKDNWGVIYAPGKFSNWPVITSNKSVPKTGPTSFHASREHGKRYHAGIDLYAMPGDIIVAGSDGIFLNYVAGYVGLDAMLVQHGNINVLYGEFVAIKGFKSGDKITAGQKLGIMANSKGKSPDAVLSSMLHLETWDSSVKFDMFQPWKTSAKMPTGLLDPTRFLEKTLNVSNLLN